MLFLFHSYSVKDEFLSIAQSQCFVPHNRHDIQKLVCLNLTEVQALLFYPCGLYSVRQGGCTHPLASALFFDLPCNTSPLSKKAAGTFTLSLYPSMIICIWLRYINEKKTHLNL